MADGNITVTVNARAAEVQQAIGQLQHALAQSGKLAQDRLEQMQADRKHALRWRDEAARLRLRVESLRGLCKTAVGLLHDAERDEDADMVAALIGDMEPQFGASNVKVTG